MRTQDLFKTNRSAKKLSESLQKTFGKKLNLESFETTQLEDARNKLRTQIHTARQTSGFNENIENEALTKAQFMHDAIVAELAERDEPIVDNTIQQGMAEGAEELTPNMAKYVLDQIYNSNGDVTMTDLFDEGIPGLRDMFMATAEELGLDPDEDFMDIESAVLEKLEELISGPNEMSERVRDPEDWDEGNTEPGNNFAVYINGKKWKVLPGPAGAYADSPEEKREFARLQAMAQRKSQETGKKWEVHVTGESATK